jgi:septal ring factor EnvC (AmiA/AmiB activator)
MPGRRLAAALLAGLALAASAAAPRASQPSEQELRALRGRIERLQKDLAEAEESRGGAADALRASEKAVSEANRALWELAQSRREISGRIEALARKGGEARAQIAREQALAEKLLRLQYEQGGQDRLRLLLEGRDIATLSRHLAYYGYIQRSRADVLGKLRQAVEELAALEREGVKERAELAENQSAQARETARLEKEREARAGVLKRISGQIAQGRREIGRLKRDEQRLTRLVEEIARSLAAKPAPRKESPAAGARRKGTPVEDVADASIASRAFATLKGRLKLPVRGELVNRYGSPREEGGMTWRGLFIRAATGETVRAVADGRVVFADWLRGFGNLLILDHGTGYMSLYGYNEGLLRQVGEAVKGGDPVAQVGASGGAEESGLYFELRLDGRPFDPLRWVAR